MPNTKKVYHPTLPDHAPLEVPEADVDAWAEQGWRKTPLRETDSTDAPKGKSDK